MSIYPDAVDGLEQLPLVVDGVTEVNAFSVNNLREAIVNVETELGVRPSGTFDTVRARLDAVDSGLDDIEDRVEALEVAVADIEDELGSNPSGSFSTVADRLTFIEASTTAPLGLIAGEDLTVGDLLRVNTSGEVVKADNTGSEFERVIGTASSTELTGASVDVLSSPGKLVSMRFAAAPAAASNGSLVYLSVTGLATLTAPTAVGTYIFVVGVLQGADGITVTPDVIFYPEFVGGNG